MNFNKTPLLQNMRSAGGTLYVFPSASEDIGLNLNSRSNTVAMSHFALLDIPDSDTNYDGAEDKKAYLFTNHFNPTLIGGHFSQYYGSSQNTYRNGEENGSWHLAASLQNYAMNFETLLLNQDSYRYQNYDTVSERVFFKWLKESGAIRFKQTFNEDSPSIKAYEEGDAYADAMSDSQDPENAGLKNLYKSVVKCFGIIDSGNSMGSEFGMYNETYVTIPTSYGAGKVFFRTRFDDISQDVNYLPNTTYIINDDTKLEGRELDNDTRIYTTNVPFTDKVTESTNGEVKVSTETVDGMMENMPWYQAHGGVAGVATGFYRTEGAPDYKKWMENGEPSDPLTDNIFIKCDQDSYGDSQNYAYRRSRLDGIEIIKDIPTVNAIWNKKLGNSEPVTVNGWDDININERLEIQDQFQFNAILLYYSVFDSNDLTRSPLATNLFGVLFLDAPIATKNAVNSGVNTGFYIPGIDKRKTVGKTSGTGFSFKVNIKTTSVYDNADAIINDNTTSNSILSTDFNGVVQVLNTAISYMNTNVETTKEICRQYASILSLYKNTDTNLNDLSSRLMSYVSGNRSAVLNTSLLNTDFISPATQDRITFEFPTGAVDISNNKVYYDQITYVDVSGVHTPNIDASALYKSASYVYINKPWIQKDVDGSTYIVSGDEMVYNPELDTSSLVRTTALRRDAENFLQYLFEVNQFENFVRNNDTNIPTSVIHNTSTSWKCGISVLVNSYNDDSKYYGGDGKVWTAQERPYEFYIDPDSPAFNVNSGNMHLNYLMTGKEDVYDENGVLLYTKANIDYERLMPYVIAYIQNFGSTIERIVRELPLAGEEARVYDELAKIVPIPQTGIGKEWVTFVNPETLVEEDIINYLYSDPQPYDQLVGNFDIRNVGNKAVAAADSYDWGYRDLNREVEQGLRMTFNMWGHDTTNPSVGRYQTYTDPMPRTSYHKSILDEEGNETTDIEVANILKGDDVRILSSEIIEYDGVDGVTSYVYDYPEGRDGTLSPEKLLLLDKVAKKAYTEYDPVLHALKKFTARLYKKNLILEKFIEYMFELNVGGVEGKTVTQIIDGLSKNEEDDEIQKFLGLEDFNDATDVKSDVAKAIEEYVSTNLDAGDNDRE